VRGGSAFWGAGGEESDSSTGKAQGGGAIVCGTTGQCDENGEPVQSRRSSKEYKEIRKEVRKIQSELKGSLSTALKDNAEGRAVFEGWYKSAQRHGYRGGQAEFKQTLNRLYNAVKNEQITFHDSNSWDQFAATQTGQDIGAKRIWAGAAVVDPAKGELHLKGVHINMDDTVWSGAGTVMSPRNLVLHEFAHMAGMPGSHDGKHPWNWIPGNTQPANQSKEYGSFFFPF
jgi:hypothetical protein